MNQFYVTRASRILTFVLLFTYLFCIQNSVLAQRDIELNLTDIYSEGKLAGVDRNLSIGQESSNKYLKIELKLVQEQLPYEQVAVIPIEQVDPKIDLPTPTPPCSVITPHSGRLFCSFKKRWCLRIFVDLDEARKMGYMAV